MTEESVEKNVNKVGGSGAAVTETLHTPYKCAEKTNDKQRRQSDILRTPDALGDSTYIPTKHSKNGTVNATEKDGGTSEPDHYRVAVIETAVISVVVLLCLAAAVAIMFFLAVRPSYVKTISTYRGERLEHAWKKYDEKEQIEPGNICQNFPGPYKKLVKFIKRPYQVIGDPCEDYYGLVCSGICHIVPKGLCFWDVSRKFQRDCVYRKPDGDTVELWMNILAFTKRSHIPIRLPSQCQEEIEKRYAEELSLIHGGNVRIKRALLERILFYIDYLKLVAQFCFFVCRR
ncbi:hypothetical protein BIW11_07952 [Tropilaelaps mercedesae]|uniref:Uncharacterized protein n=1 Tax=Tropilaelaps mercedesae TaxID=418985 RepID=A0A1V9XRW4_9ACAR|nr:hypothetical protein BIW11_07952 [Tropilaelaps mercedesae]